MHFHVRGNPFSLVDSDRVLCETFTNQAFVSSGKFLRSKIHSRFFRFVELWKNYWALSLRGKIAKTFHILIVYSLPAGFPTYMSTHIKILYTPHQNYKILLLFLFYLSSLSIALALSLQHPFIHSFIKKREFIFCNCAQFLMKAAATKFIVVEANNENGMNAKIYDQK